MKPKIVKRMQSSMQVLHLPLNITSEIGITVHALLTLALMRRELLLTTSVDGRWLGANSSKSLDVEDCASITLAP